jgi:hypothetical protein
MIVIASISTAPALFFPNRHFRHCEAALFAAEAISPLLSKQICLSLGAASALLAAWQSQGLKDCFAKTARKDRQ